jgi:Hint domain
MPGIVINRLDEDPHETVHGIRDDTSSRGVDLDGARITLTYADGTTETLTWHATDLYTNGAAVGENTQMSFGYDWHHLETTKPLATMEIDLQPASSVFDTTTAPDDDPNGGSTPTSLEGFPFRVSADSRDLAGDLEVTYAGIVNLAGSPPAGDLFTTMTVDFSALPKGGLVGSLDWKSDIDTMREEGDLVSTGVACFTRGTLITTDEGDLPVETLAPGARVLTQGSGYQELVAALRRSVGASELARNPKLYPIRISAGALGAGLPERDLMVSRQHRMVARSGIVKRVCGAMAVLVAAIRLTELPGVHIDDRVAQVEYFHLIFKQHEVVYAEGAPSESFLLNAETIGTLSHAQREEFATLFPTLVAGDGFGASAHPIPPGAVQKRLIEKHKKNGRALLSV